MKRLTLVTICLTIYNLSYSQVISDWTVRDTVVVTSMEEGTIKDEDYSAKGILSDWNSILNDFEENKFDEGEQTKLEKLTQNTPESQTKITTLKGISLNLPCIMDENGTDLFMLTREGIYIYMAIDDTVFNMEPDNDICRWILYYAFEKRNYTKNLFARYEKWEPLIKRYFVAKGIPEELAELCLIESGCTYEAVSPAGAVGMWQIMPETGRRHGLVINEKQDDRKDPVLSTIAATKILTSNYKRVGEWTLAAAAYNCGSGNIEKQIRQGKNTWDRMKSSLPKETQQYIPGLIAIHYVWTYRDRLGLTIKH